jgi:phosphatidylserine/phosphatidylglycerophosphate/cardiolipin synthase-like enzyme
VARLLDAVTPLGDLLARTPDPDATVASIRGACSDGAAAVLQVILEAASAAGIDARLMALAAAQAGITATDDSTPTVAELSAIGGALEILVDTRREPDVSLVFTVPAFLARAFDAFTTKTPAVRAERTAAVMLSVATAARSSLTIAAPFLATVAVDALVPPAMRVLDAGGVVTVVTRALSPRSPEPAQANITAVDALRHAAAGRPGRLRVSSWEEDGLGVHLKAIVADDTDAYLGSANLTGPGQAGYAEAGVRLPPRLARPLAEWLGLLADALDARRGVAAYRR